MRGGMCRIRRRLRGRSVLPKTQRNHAVLLRTRFTTLWRSEMHINRKIDAGAHNRYRRRFCVRRTVYYIYQGQWRQYAGKCACVYGICSVKNKIVNEKKCYRQYFQPNLTELSQTLQNSPSDKIVYRKSHVVKMREGMYRSVYAV